MMATKPSLAILSLLCFLLMFQNGLATRQQQQQQQKQAQFQQQRNECQIQRIQALEPTGRAEAEAGLTEFWDHFDQQFQCAGVAVTRHTVQPRGLLLPTYTNAPLLVYIVQGRGMNGVVMPGCPETFQSSQQQQQQQGQERGQGQRFQDQHQKIRQFREGDILAFPAGVAHWIYNDGDRDVIAIVLLDTSNNLNQLDLDPRRFYLAGSPQWPQWTQGREQQQQQQHQGQRQQQQQHHQRGQGRGEEERLNNVFSGFEEESLAKAFGVDVETARKLQGQDDRRGHIVRVERGLQVVRPPLGRSEEEQEQEQHGGGRRRGGEYNGLEETICSMRLMENINDPSRADVFNPRAGRLTTLNSLNLPILRYLQLSADRVVLHRNAMVAPHWVLNAHSVVYVTRGEAEIQIVDHRGQAVFQDVVREGQLVVVPQNFAVVKRAGEQGCEWIAFKTNDLATTNTLAGRTSAIRAMPVDVIANAYRISRQQAFNLKFNREATTLFAPTGTSSRRPEMWASE